jgi:hypothetical protein
MPFVLLQHPLRRFKGFEHGFGAGLAFGSHVLNPRAKASNKDFGSPQMASVSNQLDSHIVHKARSCAMTKRPDKGIVSSG